MKRLRVLSVLTVICLTGCAMAIKPASSDMNIKAKKMTPRRGKALVYIVRPGFIGKPFAAEVIVDGKKAGSTCGGYYIVFMIKPGKHHIVTSRDNTAELDVSFKSGRTYFIEQKMYPGMMKGIIKLEVLKTKDGRKKLSECSLSSDNKLDM